MIVILFRLLHLFVCKVFRRREPVQAVVEAVAKDHTEAAFVGLHRGPPWAHLCTRDRCPVEGKHVCHEVVCWEQWRVSSIKRDY